MSKEMVIYGLYLGFIGLLLLLYLMHLIRKNNEALKQAYTGLNKELMSSYENIFIRFEQYMNTYFENHKKEIEMFNNVLKKETDSYSEAINNFRSTILSLKQSSIDIVESNRQISNQMSGVVFSDLKKINDSLKEINASYNGFENRLNANLTSLTELLQGLSPMQKSFESAERNFAKLDELNNNFVTLIKSVKESSIQMQLVSNNISVLMETSLKPVVTEITSLIPELRKETLSISADLFDNFDELVKNLDSANKKLQEITDTYRMILDGNKQDPVTKSFA